MDKAKLNHASPKLMEARHLEEVRQMNAMIAIKKLDRRFCSSFIVFLVRLKNEK